MVILSMNEWVGMRCVIQGVDIPPKSIRPQGMIESNVEEGLVVIAPYDAVRDIGDRVSIDLAGLEVLDTQLVLLITGIVDRERQQLAIGAWLDVTNGAVLLALSKEVLIQQHILLIWSRFRCTVSVDWSEGARFYITSTRDTR